MDIAIIIGSTRPGRIGEQVARWVLEQAQASKSADVATFELVDLKDYDLDLLNEPTVPGAANREYENPKTRRWSEKIDGFDGYVFVTPEYNHGVPAALKNAFDVLYPEWAHKCIAFVGYGAESGVRAVEHWRTIVASAQMHATRGQVALSTMDDFTDQQDFTPREYKAKDVRNTLAQLVKLTRATSTLRA